MKNILVTGGAGYLGSVLIDYLLEDGYNVTVKDSFLFGRKSLTSANRLEVYEQDLKSITIPPEIDTVIHLGAMVYTGGKEYMNHLMDINFDGTKRVVDLCKSNGIDLIFTSTCSNYGITEKDATEETILKPISPYSISKVSAEKYILDNYPRATILRLSTAFGLSPRMRFDLLINNLVLNSMMGIESNIYSPNAWRPYIHTTDIARAIRLCLYKNVRGEIFNVGGSMLNLTKADIYVSILNHIPDAKINVDHKSDDKDQRNYRVSFQKIWDQLRFKPKMDLDDGIGEIKEALKYGVFNNPFDIRYDNVRMYKKLYGTEE